LVFSTDAIREALINQSEQFAGRPYLYVTHATLKGKGLISSPYNIDYSEHKNFLIKSFNRFGRRRSSLETTCLESVRDTLNEYRDNTNGIFLSSSSQIKNTLSRIASKNVLTMAFGLQSYEKKKFGKLMDLITANFQSTNVAAAYNFLPITRIFQTSIIKNVLKCSEFLNDLVKQRMENFNPDSADNIIDAYLIELNKNMNPVMGPLYEQNDETQNEVPNRKSANARSRRRYGSFSFDHLNSMVQDLFVAGTETISNTLQWAIIYVAYFQECQSTIHREIDDRIGREKLPTEEDRFKLTYVEAFLNETMRFHCAGPIMIPRSTTVKTKFLDYTLPENTFVLVNMWSTMRDKAYWTDPDSFKPERFLDPNGKLDLCNPAMMPFSVGKRACIGESLARSQLFLVFASLLQKFQFSFQSDNVLKNSKILDGIAGMALTPPNVPMKMKIR
jgi:hypothetical protein